MLFVLALVLGLLAPIAALAGVVGRVTAAWSATAAWLGVVLVLVGFVAVLLAQTGMGSSWRIGVRQEERTDLVTTGVFAWARNPVFTAMLVAQTGLTLMVPSSLSLAALLCLLAAVQLQVRRIEEPFLLRQHGPAYAAYAARTGRFVPGVGRLRTATPAEGADGADRVGGVPVRGGHPHGHVLAPPAGGPASRRHRRRMLLVLCLTLSVVGVQLAGGLLSGSLALLADAGHMLTDAAGVGIALIAGAIAVRPASDARSYGWQRAEILAALANALLLTGIAVWVLVQAAGRWSDPPEVATGLMLGAAVIGGLANAASLLLLRLGDRALLGDDLLGDLLASVAVVVAGLVILTTGYTRADVLASVLIGLMILPRAWSLLRDVVDVLLEATPRGVDMEAVREHITEVPGVVDVHVLHAWTITSGVPVLSAHVVVDDACMAAGRSGEVLDQLGACLTGHFDVAHCTFQLEPVGHSEHEPGHHR